MHAWYGRIYNGMNLRWNDYTEGLWIPFCSFNFLYFLNSSLLTSICICRKEKFLVLVYLNQPSKLGNLLTLSFEKLSPSLVLFMYIATSEPTSEDVKLPCIGHSWSGHSTERTLPSCMFKTRYSLRHCGGGVMMCSAEKTKGV